MKTGNKPCFFPLSADNLDVHVFKYVDDNVLYILISPLLNETLV